MNNFKNLWEALEMYGVNRPMPLRISLQAPSEVPHGLHSKWMYTIDEVLLFQEAFGQSRYAKKYDEAWKTVGDVLNFLQKKPGRWAFFYELRLKESRRHLMEVEPVLQEEIRIMHVWQQVFAKTKDVLTEMKNSVAQWEEACGNLEWFQELKTQVDLQFLLCEKNVYEINGLLTTKKRRIELFKHSMQMIESLRSTNKLQREELWSIELEKLNQK